MPNFDLSFTFLSFFFQLKKEYETMHHKTSNFNFISKDRGVTYTNELKSSLVQLSSDVESMKR